MSPIILFGLIILVIGFTIKRNALPLGQYKNLIVIGGLLVTLVGIGQKLIKIIDGGTVGVQKLFGEYDKEILSPGLNIVNPLKEVIIFNIQTQKMTMGQEGDSDSAPIKVLSEDGLEVIIDLSVIYKVDPLKTPWIVEFLGDYKNKIIVPEIRSKIRSVAATYNAIQLYSEKKEEFYITISSMLEKSFGESGILLEEILIRNIELPESVKASIERKITADQEAQRMTYVLRKEEQEAERKRVEAQGVADAQRIITQGLSQKILQFEQIKVQKELVKSPNSKIIILGDSKNSPPFIIGN